VNVERNSHVKDTLLKTWNCVLSLGLIASAIDMWRAFLFEAGDVVGRLVFSTFMSFFGKSNENGMGLRNRCTRFVNIGMHMARYGTIQFE
jgi:hypothetical protein